MDLYIFFPAIEQVDLLGLQAIQFFGLGIIKVVFGQAFAIKVDGLFEAKITGVQ